MIEILTAGLFTTIQDQGRWGYQAFGMPVAGAMDRYACRVANIMAGNSPEAACLEMTLTGDSLRFEKETFAAVSGADMQATLNGEPVANWSAFPVPAGSVLTFGYAQEGCRSYLAVNGGIDVPLVLGSRSTYTRAAVGGLEGRKLRAGDVLKIGGQALLAGASCALPQEYRPACGSSITLRVITGPQDDLFSAEGLATLFNSSYTISNEADRMGYRLEGPVIAHKAKADIVSDALCQGAIQVPGHGMPIVMMADRATTGGYTKIGTVIGPDLTLMAQAKPGDTVSFRQCSDGGAVEALRTERERYAAIAAWRAGAAGGSPAEVKRFRMTVNGQSYSIEISEER
ncbi:MAG: biotin-dependent carboxyltransferase family protein [Negativicutes bacterium]|nr:biotin-dependent carboxyltransferase family protein [Negativicutes bacterium]